MSVSESVYGFNVPLDT